MCDWLVEKQVSFLLRFHKSLEGSIELCQVAYERSYYAVWVLFYVTVCSWAVTSWVKLWVNLLDSCGSLYAIKDWHIYIKNHQGDWLLCLCQVRFTKDFLYRLDYLLTVLEGLESSFETCQREELPLHSLSIDKLVISIQDDSGIISFLQ